MSEYTSTLNLFKYDTAADGKEVFSIDKSLNENWDKLDAFAAGIKSLSNLSPEGENRFTQINTELSKKLEADVLLAENGYIKFNNGLIIQYGSGSIPFAYTSGSDRFSNVHSTTLNLLVSFELIGTGFCITAWGDYSYTGNCSANCTLSSITLSVGSDNNRSVPCYWFAIGY